MSWLDRLYVGAYTAPSGKRMTFDYEDLGRATEKNVMEFDTIGGYSAVQYLGRRSNKFPMRIYFHGENNDTDADAFFALLMQGGSGTLEHPRYGSMRAIPFGEVTQNDYLVTAANQSVIEVTFYQTGRSTVVPLSAGGSVSELADASTAALADDFIGALGDDFAEVAAETTLAALKASVSGVMDSVSSVMSDYQSAYKDVMDSINGGLDSLVRDPLTLAFQLSVAIRQPLRDASLLYGQLDAYKSLAETIIKNVIGNTSYTSESKKNAAAVASLAVQSVAIAAAEAATSVTTDDVKNRGVAVDMADKLADVFFAVSESVSGIESLYSDLSGDFVIEAGASSQSALLDLAGASSVELADLIHSALPSATVYLDRESALPAVASRYYGGIDNDTLDKVISVNDLAGDEIVIIPRGRKLVIYGND